MDYSVYAYGIVLTDIASGMKSTDINGNKLGMYF